MNTNKRAYILYLISCIIAALVIFITYYVTGKTLPNADTNLSARNIETPAKLLLNGYLGPLFGFKYLGSINWLIIPLFVIYLIYFKPALLKKHYALIVFFFLAFILIALKGFFNPRYAFTLLAFILFFVFYFLWKIHEIPQLKKMKYFSVALMFLFIVINFLKSTNTSRFNEKRKAILEQKNETETQNISANIFDTINKFHNDAAFLVNNLPDFYYNTNKKGFYYWCGDDHYYSPKGRMLLFGKMNTEEILSFLKEKNCIYIYTHKTYENYNKTFDEFIKNHCVLIAEDIEKRMLYMINS